ncbi:hypothetical protein FQN60_000470, partial [Etheostoma spectabile]
MPSGLSQSGIREAALLMLHNGLHCQSQLVITKHCYYFNHNPVTPVTPDTGTNIRSSKSLKVQSGSQLDVAYVPHTGGKEEESQTSALHPSPPATNRTDGHTNGVWLPLPLPPPLSSLFSPRSLPLSSPQLSHVSSLGPIPCHNAVVTLLVESLRNHTLEGDPAQPGDFSLSLLDPKT